MSKKLKELNKEMNIYKKDLRYILDNKYYNAWLRLSTLVEGLDTKEAEFIFRQFWGVGQVCAFKADGLEDNTILFAPFSVMYYDLYDYPVMAMPINQRGSFGFPTNPLRVNEDIVLGYCMKSKKSIKSIVDIYINKIIQVESIIQINLRTHKMPFLVISSIEDENKLDLIMDMFDDDFPTLKVSAEVAEKLKTLNTNTPYIIDKLYSYKQSLEDELNTFLGCDNSKLNQPRMLVDQVNANNQEINESKDLFKNTIEEFFEKVGEVLGKTIKWKEDAFIKIRAVNEKQGGTTNEE